ncbi:uncharacterized protein LOC111687403 [Lucilia cuprina]|uniref:uncharacterized protein LOC111687403 n=1 Tax=Lucilia cuprina TaxID=7375 RepID=UPI001F0636D4|nr:uncharacterized protein LOC111687403 [Lucilia cuprina]
MTSNNFPQLNIYPQNQMEYIPSHQVIPDIIAHDNVAQNYEPPLSEGQSSSGMSCSTPSVELMQINGRKVLGPPEDWVGPPPSSVCELFVRRIPKDLNENKLLAPFLRFGQIYEFRLPLDFNQANRGYAYVKYTNEEDASSAMEVLNHYYVFPGRKLEILHSYEKCRLFVSNIPKHLEESEIEESLRTIFPTMQRIYIRPSSATNTNDGNFGAGVDGAMQQQQAGTSSVAAGLGNRGHVFVHFATHMHALEAKKCITPGLVRMWGRDLKVVWANTERDSDMSKSSKTLFVRNVDLTVNKSDIIDFLVKHVPRTAIRKISKVRTTAFFDFTSREAAEYCLKELQGTILRGKRLDLEWAKPSEQQSLHRMRNKDFDAVLRLKCIANGWHIPVIIFGCYYEQERVQYAMVVLRDSLGNVRATFCILNSNELVDIHSRMCEVVCVLIESVGGFPSYNYVFQVEKDVAHLLGMVSLNLHNVEFVAACGVPSELNFDLTEILDLSWAAISLAPISEDTLLNAYKESFLTHSDCTYLQNWPLIQHRIFGTIMPKYRNKPPLKYNLNDTQIVMALCFKATGTNVSLPTRPYVPFAACAFKQIFEGLRYVSLQLLPVALTQSRSVVSHNLSHIQFGGCKYYHPAQRILSPPLWLTGCSYNESIKQPEVCFNATMVPTPATTQVSEHQSKFQSNYHTTVPAVTTNNVACLMQYHQAPQHIPQHQQQYFAVTSQHQQQQQVQTQPSYFTNMPASIAPSFTLAPGQFMSIPQNNFGLST